MNDTVLAPLGKGHDCGAYGVGVLVHANVDADALDEDVIEEDVIDEGVDDEGILDEAVDEGVEENVKEGVDGEVLDEDVVVEVVIVIVGPLKEDVELEETELDRVELEDELDDVLEPRTAVPTLMAILTCGMRLALVVPDFR